MSQNTSEHYVILKDAFGEPRTFEVGSLTEQMAKQMFSVFGMYLPVLRRVRHELLKAGLPINPQEEDIIAFFDYLRRQGVLADGSEENQE